ncbi:hypothetical protein KGN64_003211 [Salmonella enterica]|nr:hypothetical protein [Salmonella enterica]EHM5264028.1 hypothetical protein [Salmonella enterica]
MNPKERDEYITDLKYQISHLEYRLKNVQDAHRYWADRAIKNESAAGLLFLANRRIAELEAKLALHDDTDEG